MIVLGAKTDYSFQRGFGTPKQWLERCQETGTTTLGVADYCSTWGHAPFRDAFKDSGVKLLYGVQLPVVAYLDKDPRHSLVTLYAKIGLTELYQAVTLAHSQTYYRPRLTWKQIRSLTDCVVVVNRVMHTHRKVATSIDGIYDASGELETRKVIDYSPRYPSPDDRVGFNILLQNSSQSRIGEIEIEPIHLLRESELARRYEGSPLLMGLGNRLVADECTATIPQAGLLPYPEIVDKRGRLYLMAMDGAKRLGMMVIGPDVIWNAAYSDRLQYELDIICEKKFEDYFFFVAEICEWAESRMLIGPGRGSAGGSLLCYLLGITHVDPIKFGTMFERFIDVTRSDLPDIDIDFDGAVYAIIDPEL